MTDTDFLPSALAEYADTGRGGPRPVPRGNVIAVVALVGVIVAALVGAFFLGLWMRP